MWLKREAERDLEIREWRLRNVRLQNQLSRQDAGRRSTDTARQQANLINYEQLKIENQTYNEKIEERTEVGEIYLLGLFDSLVCPFGTRYCKFELRLRVDDPFFEILSLGKRCHTHFALTRIPSPLPGCLQTGTAKASEEDQHYCSDPQPLQGKAAICVGLPYSLSVGRRNGAVEGEGRGSPHTKDKAWREFLSVAASKGQLHCTHRARTYAWSSRYTVSIVCPDWLCLGRRRPPCAFDAYDD